MANKTVKVPCKDLEDKCGKVVVVNDKLKIAVFKNGDRYAAINNRCPHAGGSLGDGPFDGTTVQCPLHGFKVDVWKGVGNAGKPVQKFAVEEKGGQLLITVPDAK